MLRCRGHEHKGSATPIDGRYDRRWRRELRCCTQHRRDPGVDDCAVAAEHRVNCRPGRRVHLGVTIPPPPPLRYTRWMRSLAMQAGKKRSLMRVIAGECNKLGCELSLVSILPKGSKLKMRPTATHVGHREWGGTPNQNYKTTKKRNNGDQPGGPPIRETSIVWPHPEPLYRPVLLDGAHMSHVTCAHVALEPVRGARVG